MSSNVIFIFICTFNVLVWYTYACRSQSKAMVSINLHLAVPSLRSRSSYIILKVEDFQDKRKMPNVRKHPNEFLCQGCRSTFSNKQSRPVNKYCCINCYQATRNIHYRRKIIKKQCLICGFTPEHLCQLDIDHIDGNHKNNNPDNLQVLCANCHRLKSYKEKVNDKTY